MVDQTHNILSFKVKGRKALFSDPLTRVGGEKLSYDVPTYEAIKGITESIFWKPTIRIIPLRVRVMKPIRMRAEGIRPIAYNGGNTLSQYTYLSDVEYNVEFRFVWNEARPDLAPDRNDNKYYFMFKRMIEKGGRRDIYLGTRECQGYVEPCTFEEGKGYYDKKPDATADELLDLGVMLHGISYPDETGSGELGVRLWHCTMKNGIIEFPAPEECTLVRTIRKSDIKTFTLNKNVEPIEITSKEAGCDGLEQRFV